jgi:regulator of PEP synthase PpsR (kinase-PPPase family)
MYLANRRLKVANVPLVPEVKPPEELFTVPRNRVIGLVIRLEQLNHIRTERLRAMGVGRNTSYSDPARILEELDYADRLMRRLRCPVVDVTNKAVEETASRILEIYDRGARNEPT